MCVKIHPEGKKTLQIQCADVDEASERVQTNKGWWLELHYIHLSDAGVQIIAQYGYFSHLSGKKWPNTGKTSVQIICLSNRRNDTLEKVLHYKCKYWINITHVKYWKQNVIEGIISESTHYAGCGYVVILNDQFHRSLTDISISRYYQTVLPFKDRSVSWYMLCDIHKYENF